ERGLVRHRKKASSCETLTSWREQGRDWLRTRKDNGREGHSLSGDGRGRDLSGHRKKSTNRGALTLWRRQREGLVRTQKEIDQPRHTHFLETAEGGTCQDMERNRPTEAHSLSGDGRGRDLSGHRKKST